MTPEEFSKEMQAIVDKKDTPDCQHANLDDLMCKALLELGYGDGVSIFEKAEKWYE